MISPHRFAQFAKEDLVSGVTEECADIVLARFDVVPDIVARIVGDIVGDVPRCIPAKYHKKIMEIFVTSYMNAMYAKTTHPYSLAEKHSMMKHALRYVGNVREC